jgi:hypothetical protein
MVSVCIIVHTGLQHEYCTLDLEEKGMIGVQGCTSRSSRQNVSVQYFAPRPTKQQICRYVVLHS